jgi:DNA-binding response OmpR family regulator
MRVLIVEDDESLSGLLVELLGSWGMEVKEVNNISDGMGCIKDFRPDVLILDLLLGGKISTPLINEARKQIKPPCLIICSALGQLEGFLTEHKPDYFLKKPFDIETIEDIFSKISV